MKTFFITAFIFYSISASATNFYISTQSGNDNRTSAQAQDSSTPWKSIGKLNAFNNLQPGDSVLFKRGEVFYGTLHVSKSGAAGRPIVYGAYGRGTDPVITGFNTVTEWTNLGGNIWESTSAISGLSTCNMVLVNGANTAMGRYPNTGYLTYQSYKANTSITSSAVNSSVVNWTGAEAVIKKQRWVIDRNLITGHSGNTLTCSGGGYNGQNGWGFFIQNDSRTLDAPNEWYYNPLAKKIRIYSSGLPGNVQVSAGDTLVAITYKNYITFDHITFTGANKYGMLIRSSASVTVQDCRFDGCYNAITGQNYGLPSAGFLLQNCVIDHTGNNAVQLPAEFNNAGILNNTIKNTAVVPGAGGSGDGTYGAIHCKSSRGMIRYNTLDSTGYNGISCFGDAMNVSNNTVSNFCLVKDDGGGIYTQGASAGMVISYNTVVNGPGNGEGVADPGSSRAEGIYCDEPTSGIHILNNAVANVGFAGIYLHDSHDIELKNNTVYNNPVALFIKNDNAGTSITNLDIKNNILFARTATQFALRATTLHNDVKGFGAIDSNYYARPIDDNLVFFVQSNGEDGRSEYYSLSQWQLYLGQSMHSLKSPKAITSLNDLRFEYNPGSSYKTIPLDATYIDVKGTLYPGRIVLAPYSSAALIRSGTLTNQAPKANAGPDQVITLPFNTTDLSGSGMDTDGNISSYSWKKLPGSSMATIINADSAKAKVTGLAKGIYYFELNVTDNSGATGKDTLQVTVTRTGYGADDLRHTKLNAPPLTAKILPGNDWLLPVKPAAGTVQQPAFTVKKKPAASFGTLSYSSPEISPVTIAAEHALSVYPNPFKSAATIQLFAAEAGPATVQIFDLRGRLIRQVFRGTVEAGESRRIVFTADGMPDGIYLVRFITKTAVQSQQITLTK